MAEQRNIASYSSKGENKGNQAVPFATEQNIMPWTGETNNSRSRDQEQQQRSNQNNQQPRNSNPGQGTNQFNQYNQQVNTAFSGGEYKGNVVNTGNGPVTNNLTNHF